MTRSLHILHVTETLATGVLDVVSRMSEHQTALGHQVTVLHSPRRETPAPSSLQARLPSARIISAGSATQGRLPRLRALRSALRRFSRSNDVDVTHLHSSFAGAVGRVCPGRGPLVYSPHGFAFLRQDVPRLQARAFQMAEAVLARGGDAVLCVSASEEHVARKALRAKTLLVPNRLSLDELQPRSEALTDGTPLVVNIGRWSPQKAPERFVNAARTFHGEARFRWIGDAPAPVASEISTTGWIEPAAVVRELSAASIIYFTSRWEGMPVGLMQAQALGVPAVALRCVGVDDVIIDGVTGVVVDDEGAAQRELGDLLKNPDRLARMRAAAVAHRTRFSDEGYGEQLMSAYEEVLNRHA